MPNFREAVEFVLKNEGGYSKDPYDPGGETKFGISKRSYPDLDIPSLTMEEAMTIYQTNWWSRYHYTRIESQQLATKILDMSVNMGPKKAHKIVQRALNTILHCKLKVDGILGDKTFSALNSVKDVEQTHRAMSHYQAKFYESLWTRVKKLTRFKRGWLRRAFL